MGVAGPRALVGPVTFCVQLGSLAAEHWSASRKFSVKKCNFLKI